MRRRRLLFLALLVVVAAVSLARSEPARATEPQKLFALDAKEGTLTPVAGKPGIFDLVLEPVRAQAIFFTDRPGREVGTVAVRAMLRRLFAGNSPDPNAAVNATAANRGQLLMGVELLGWSYDARHERLALRVRHLPQGGRTIGKVRDDTILPRSFRDTSIFIDDCCSVEAAATVFNTSASALEMSINSGAQITVAGASTETWLPGSESISFAPAGPEPGVLGPGTNYVAIIPVGGTAPIAFPIDLPSQVPFRSLELYLFLGPGGLEWTLLDDGQLVTSGTKSTG